jgi:hypothetical protein
LVLLELVGVGWFLFLLLAEYVLDLLQGSMNHLYMKLSFKDGIALILLVFNGLVSVLLLILIVLSSNLFASVSIIRTPRVYSVVAMDKARLLIQVWT